MGRDGGIAVLQRGKKEGESASAYHCALGSAARGDCPMFPKGIGKSAENACKTRSAWLGRFVGTLGYQSSAALQHRLSPRQSSRQELSCSCLRVPV